MARPWVKVAFNGDTAPSVLDLGNTLNVGESGTVTLVVRVDPGTVAGPYECSSIATGTSPESVVVMDVSQDGGDPDPDDDGDANNDDIPTLVTLPVNILDIPTLDSVGLGMLALLLTLGAFGALRRRRT